MTSDSLAQIVAAVLKGATGAANNVYSPRDWPVPDSVDPILAVQTPHDVSESRGRVGGPQFRTQSTIRVEGKITGKAMVDATNAERGAQVVLDAIGLLARQCKKAIVGNPQVMDGIEQILRIETQNKVSAESGKHVGKFTMDFVFEFPEDPEDFDVVEGDPLEQFAIYADLVNVADPTGTYTPPIPGYTPTPAPRTIGPDGRVEIGAIINLPQE